MKSTALFWPRGLFAPQAEFDAAGLRRRGRVRERGQIGGTIGDMDAVEQPMAEQPRRRDTQHRFRSRRNELHGAALAMAQRSRRSCCAPAGDSGLPRDRAAKRWYAPAIPRRMRGPRHRASPTPRQIPSARRAATMPDFLRRQHVEMAERDQKRGADERQRGRRTPPRGARRTSEASSGTTTSQIAAKDSMPPVVSATIMTRLASASDDSTCAPS